MDNDEKRPNLPQALCIAYPYTRLGVILAVALAVRLFAVGSALLGNFATKNVVYAMIARNLIRGQASFWFPRIDCLRAGQRGLHLLELPLSAYLAGGLWGLLGGSLDVWGRAVSIGFSLAAILVLYNLVHRHHGHSAAIGAAAVLALSPVAVLYGQCFMLEASIVFFMVMTIDALDRWLVGRRVIWLVVATTCFMLLALTKIYMLVLLLPIGYMLCRVRARTRQLDTPQAGACELAEQRVGACKHAPYMGRPYIVLVLFIVAALPAVVWVGYVMRAASPGGVLADEVFYSLADSTQAHRPPDPLLTQADFYRQIFDDLAGVVLTPVAFMLPLVGLLDRSWRRWAAWLVAMGFLVLVMPRKFFEMNYYWLVVLPPIAVMAGLGWARLERCLRPSRFALAVLLTLALLVSFRFTAGPLLKVPDEDRAVLPAAEAVRALAAEDEPIVTMHGSGIDLLYYCDRSGWALEPDEADLAERLTEFADKGARLLVIVDVDRYTSPDRDGRLENMMLKTEGDGFRIYKITGGL